MSKEISLKPEEYESMLQQAVEHIRTTRIVVAKQINSATQSIYWNLGKLISEKQLAEGYGSAVVNQLSVDLKKEFPDIGLSPRNLWDMKRFYERYHQADPKLRQAVAVLPWGHNLLLINKVKSLEEVLFYAHETITKGWSRDWLLNAIKMDSYSHHKTSIQSHNFNETLPAIDTEYANEVFKDRFDVEIALQDIHKPIGVAEYQLLLPKDQLEDLLTNEMKALTTNNE